MKINIKKISKIVAVILIIMMAFTIVQPVLGAELDPSKFTPDSTGDASDLQEKAEDIMGLIRNVAIVVGVVMLMVIGVKFMLGSAEEKADYKKSLVPLAVGIVIVMMATTLVSVVYNFAK